MSGRTQWLIVLLAGLSWPFLYAVKLGQVGPILFAAVRGRLALGSSTPSVLGVSGGLGAAIKIQPGADPRCGRSSRGARARSSSGWACWRSWRWSPRSSPGTEAWSDFFTLIGRVSDPITTPHNFTPGAVAYQAGVSREHGARSSSGSSMGAGRSSPSSPRRCGCRRCRRTSIAVVASQLLSPILWDHYALILLLPVAWLIERGWTWAVADPARDLHPADRVRAARDLPDRVRRDAVRAARRGVPGSGPAEPRLRLRRRPARDRYPCDRSRGPDARRRTRGVHGSSPLPGRLGRDPARDRLVLRLLAVEPRVRRRPRRPVLPRRRLPPRPGVARLRPRPVRHHPVRRPRLRAVRPVPGDRAHAARRR